MRRILVSLGLDRETHSGTALQAIPELLYVKPAIDPLGPLFRVGLRPVRSTVVNNLFAICHLETSLQEAPALGRLRGHLPTPDGRRFPSTPDHQCLMRQH